MASPPKEALPGVGGRERSWWRWAVGVGLLAALVLVAGPRQLVVVLRTSSPGWVAVVIGGSIIWLLLGALNVWLLLRRLASVQFRVFLNAYLTSWFFSLFLPGQLGDSTQILLLRRRGVSAATSGAAYLLDKALSLAWLGLVAMAGIAFYTTFGALTWLAGLTGIVLITLAGIAVLPADTYRQRGWVGRVRAFAASIIEKILLFRRFPSDVARNFALTVVKWGFATGLYFTAFRAIGAPIGVRPAATIPFIGSLVGYVPVTVGGAGTMELTAVVLFGQLGVEAARVLSAYLLVRGAVLLAMLLLLGFVSLMLAEGRS